MEEAVEKGRATGVPLGQSLIDAGIVDSNQLAQALAERNGLDYVDLNAFEVDQGAANLIDAAKARRYQTIPISFLGEQTLLVATADPANVLALDDIAMATGYEVRRAVASPEDIDALIGQLSRLGDAVEELEDDPESAAEVIELRDQADEAPVVKLVALGDRGRRAPRRLRHPLRAARQRHARALPRRRRRDGHHDRAAPAGGRPDLAREGHGKNGHRRAAHSAGRPRDDQDRRFRDRRPPIYLPVPTNYPGSAVS